MENALIIVYTALCISLVITKNEREKLRAFFGNSYMYWIIFQLVSGVVFIRLLFEIGDNIWS